MFEKWFPACKKYGMTEEQFWRSNPRIIKTWEKAWKDEEKYKNQLTHCYVGNYFMSAVTVAVEHCLSGQKAKSKYIEKPIQLFPLTEEEKKIEQKKAIAQFVMWANHQEKKHGKEE